MNDLFINIFDKSAGKRAAVRSDDALKTNYSESADVKGSTHEVAVNIREGASVIGMVTLLCAVYSRVPPGKGAHHLAISHYACFPQLSELHQFC